MSRLLLRTLRDAPADADSAGYGLLVRGGYVRRLAAGVYTFLPLGWRVLRNLEQIVREELDAAGCQELLMPVLHPLELWQQSGRAAMFGSDALPAMQVEGRGGKFVLGPTHEEVATVLVGAEIDSYRQLPVTIYQLQSKFRDEARPRYGLLRTRELVMADAYSFDADKDAMFASYDVVYGAYLKIFHRVGLDVSPVAAESGAIGGDINHEFMVASPIGEDYFAKCSSCGYAANMEALYAPDDEGTEGPEEPLTTHHTPGRPGISEVVEFFADRQLTAAEMLKCVCILDAQGEVIVALVPGDREARLAPGWRLFEEDDFARFPQLVRGYIGPMGLVDQGISVIADTSIRTPRSWVTGANQLDHHVSGARLDRDFTVSEFAHVAAAKEGDPCPRCAGALEFVRSVEAAHTFQLGLTYSSKMEGAHFVNEAGESAPFWMGCYGIGVSRLLGVIAEAHHDEAGLAWPAEVAPYDIHLVALGAGRNPEVATAAEAIYAELSAAGIAVLYDDRDASPGVKLADADLLGLPRRVVVGKKGLDRGEVECKVRADGTETSLPLAGAAAALAAAL